MSSRQRKTSHTHPIRVDFLDGETLRLPGRLGMTILPGVKDPGRWNRDLEPDLQRLKQHYETDALVVLLEREELQRYKVPDLLERARQTDLKFVEFPIVDVSTPRKAQSGEYGQLIERLLGLLQDGKTVVVHCRGGLGRTGTVVASVLAALGHDPDDAIALVREVRSNRAVETPEQEEYVRNFARERKTEEGRRTYRHRRQEPTLRERYRGCLLGLAVGDALGTTIEFKPPGTFRPTTDMVGGGPFGLRAGEWTDDTSMALCLAESLIEKRGFDPVDQLRRYVLWYREGRMSSTGEFFDIGGTTREALERFEGTGEPYPGSTDPHAAGNGSIMRLAPVPLFYARAAVNSLGDGPQPPEVLERCAESSRTTHGARAAVDGCRYLGALIVGAVNGASKEEILSEHYTPFNGYWETRPLVREIDEIARGSFKRKEPPEIRGSGYVVASLEAALWAFHNSDSFEEGALLAVNLGDDADTTGAVYGQLAGAYYGEHGIPKPWRRKLAHRLLIEHFADKLLRLGKTVDWDKLLVFLPIFKRPGFVFAEEVTSPGYTMGNPDIGSYTEIPYYKWSPEVEKFYQALYDTGVIFPFDWGEWQEEARTLMDEPAALAEADEATLRKLLTLHARVDRFNEGHFIQMLESGHITAILRRVEALRKTP